MIRISKGLDIPISGEPQQRVEQGPSVEKVALLGGDYIGMKPTMAVHEGDRVKCGQLLFTDKKRPAVRYTAPGAGEVVAINRGERRAFLSVVIRLDDGEEEAIPFQSFAEQGLKNLSREQVVEQLLASGLWTAIRMRPFSMVADPGASPHSLFVTAMDTNPHAPDAARLLDGRQQNFINGLAVLSRLIEGKIRVCRAPGLSLPLPDLPNLTEEEFAGPHPAGNVGTHIHFLDPVHRGKTIWHIGLQDTIAVGRLFTTGRLTCERIVSLAGPGVKKPRLVSTRLGASLAELTEGELHEGSQRLISGSILAGRAVDETTAYLGRYHQQIAVLPEESERRFMSWLRPGIDRYSIKNVMLSKFLPARKFAMTTSANGERRNILPAYNYERVMPLDLLPLFLLRALSIDDLDEAERLGCLELDEEDLALCAYVCPSKQDFGPMLRRNLDVLAKE